MTSEAMVPDEGPETVGSEVEPVTSDELNSLEQRLFQVALSEDDDYQSAARQLTTATGRMRLLLMKRELKARQELLAKK
jgi:hypothetical protein